MGESVSIHTNRSLSHQVRVAEAVLRGFRRLGYSAEITGKPTDESDIHVVIGPHYAKQQNLNNRTILIDRGFWGDPDCTSLAWMRPDGGRVFLDGCPGDRLKPDLRPMKSGCRTLLLLDYGMTPNKPADEVRYHPAQKATSALVDALGRNDIAMGYLSTAMVGAAIYGLRTVPLDDRSPVKQLERISREQWLNNLSYMNWNDAELSSGEALKHLCL